MAMSHEYFDKNSLHGVDDDLIRKGVIYCDSICQEYILTAMKHYADSLRLDSKHVYEALPRLLSLWFDFASIDPSEMSKILSEGMEPSGYNSELQYPLVSNVMFITHKDSLWI